MLEKLRLVEERYLEMAERAGQPDFYADPKAASKLLREQKRLEPIVTAYRSYRKTEQEAQDLRGMLDAAADAATNALPKIDSAAQGTLVDFNIEELLSGMNFSDGTLSIPKIASIKQDLSDAGAVLKRVKTSIHALPQPRTEQITEMVNQGKQVVDQIDETFDTLNTIVEKIPG